MKTLSVVTWDERNASEGITLGHHGHESSARPKNTLNIGEPHDLATASFGLTG
jgi:hypothetical protein